MTAGATSLKVHALDSEVEVRGNVENLVKAWPALCTLAAIVLLLVLIIRFKFQAFAALLLVSLGLGLAAGMPPERVVKSIGGGVGEVLMGVAIILGLGAMLGRMLEASGSAEVIAGTLVNAFGPKRASFAILIAGYIIGIPVLFNVGFLLLIPIMWRLQRDTDRSLLYFVLPLSFSLATMHSLVPPHPGIVGAVGNMGADMIQTMLFGTLMGIPIVLVGWFGPGRFWAQRQFVTVPEQLAVKTPEKPAEGSLVRPPSFALSVLIVTLPLVLSFLGFGTQLLATEKLLPAWMTQPIRVTDSLVIHPPAAWLRFLGDPVMALFVPTGLAFVFLGLRRGIGADRLTKIAGDALQDVGVMIFLFGAAGGFKQVIQDSGAGNYIAGQMMRLPLSPVLIAFLVSVAMRVALGSATAAILTASALMAPLSKSLPGHETLLVLAVANGVTFMTQPADSGFWLIKEYANLNVRDVMFKFNACRITMALTGLGLLLAYEALFF